MKRQALAWIIIGICISILIVVYFVKGDEIVGTATPAKWTEQVVEGSGKDKILQLFVDGVIERSSGIRSTFNSNDFISQLDQGMKDVNVKAIVISVNTPGGGVVASDEIYNKILEVKAKGKPVVISMGDVAASGGYYISAPADRIFANPNTITGSLGVILSIPNYKKASELIGYKETVIKSGQYKDIGNGLRDVTDKERAIYQELVNESYQQFVDVIAKGRNLPRKEVLRIADGRVYSGRQAKRLKLVDEFGDLEDATKYAKVKAGLKEVKVVRYTPGFSFGSILKSKQQEPIAEALGNYLSLLFEPRLQYILN